MMLGIFVGAVLFIGVISAFSGLAKKILEIVSLIAKLCVCGMGTMILSQTLDIPFSSEWLELAFLLAGAVTGLILIQLLAMRFRLVAYSINYFINGFVLLVVVGILEEQLQLGFALYGAILLLFPRILWISDRFATTREYVGSAHDYLNNVTIRFFTARAVDWWQDSERSWNALPLQIVIASVFYAVGSLSIMIIKPFDSFWLIALYTLLATALNVVLDLYGLRRLEERIGQ